MAENVAGMIDTSPIAKSCMPAFATTAIMDYFIQSVRDALPIKTGSPTVGAPARF